MDERVEGHALHGRVELQDEICDVVCVREGWIGEPLLDPAYAAGRVLRGEDEGVGLVV